MYKINIVGRSIRVTGREVLASGSVNSYLCHISFNSDWEELDKTVIFRAGDVSKKAVTDGDGNYIIPWETLKKPGQTLYIGVEGSRGSELVHPTLWEKIGIVCAGAIGGDDPNPPPTDVYAEILRTANRAEEKAGAVLEASEAGAFNGPQGDPGKSPFIGDDGYWYVYDNATKDYVKTEVFAEGDVPYIGANGNWWVGDTDTGVRPDARTPLLEMNYAPYIELPVNAEVRIGTTEGPMTLTLGEGEDGYASEWIAVITQGETAYDVVLPVVEWVGNEPTFDAGTSTKIRLYYVGTVLYGEWENAPGLDLSALDGKLIRTIEPDEDGVYRFYIRNKDDPKCLPYGIYSLPKDVQLVNGYGNGIYDIDISENSIWHFAPIRNSNYTQLFGLQTNTTGRVYLKNYLSNGSRHNIDISNAALRGTNNVFDAYSLNEFKKAPIMTATLDPADDSTNIPNTAWVNAAIAKALEERGL